MAIVVGGYEAGGSGGTARGVYARVWQRDPDGALGDRVRDDAIMV
jgi:hypothetical protein